VPNVLRDAIAAIEAGEACLSKVQSASADDITSVHTLFTEAMDNLLENIEVQGALSTTDRQTSDAESRTQTHVRQTERRIWRHIFRPKSVIQHDRSFMR
jgi:hypothetical protein